jgi:alpha-glucosidase
LRIPLGFLGEGSWTARTWQDGATVSLLRTGEKAVRSSDSLALALGANGGAVVVIERRKP